MPPFAKDQVAVGPGDLQSKLRLADLQKKQVRVTVLVDQQDSFHCSANNHGLAVGDGNTSGASRDLFAAGPP